MQSLAILLALPLVVQLAAYFFWLPDPDDAPLPPSASSRALGTAAYVVAYALALLRLPFAVPPYLLKTAVFVLARRRYAVSSHHYAMEALRLLGDWLNWAALAALAVAVVGPPRWAPIPALAYAAVLAEFIRLYTEKGQMLVSAAWQFLPHRRIAHWINTFRAGSVPGMWLTRGLARYYGYYALDDQARMAWVLRALRRRALREPELLAKLAYVRAFRIVPTRVGLRAGRVRDVALGEVFIHRRWTNDPWLLAGQAVRRSPWLFDPRHLPRPFYYRTQANRLATLLVLRHARHCLPYAVYQFGHEVKAARFDFFFRVARRLGWDLEAAVGADGAYEFDPLLKWLSKAGLPAVRTSWEALGTDARPLHTEAEAVAELRASRGSLTSLEIARRYVFPLEYVEDVLLPRLCAGSPDAVAPAAQATGLALPN